MRVLSVDKNENATKSAQLGNTALGANFAIKPEDAHGISPPLPPKASPVHISNGPDNGLLSRRAALRRLGGAVALPLALGDAVAGQIAPPQNLRLSKPVLTQSDIRFAGFYRFPFSAGDLWYTYGGLTSRRVGTELRLLGIGNTPIDRTNPLNGNNPLYELALTGTPSTSIAAAPMLEFRRAWGHIMDGRMLTGGSSAGVPGGLLWDQALNGLWWTYGDSYVPVQSHPTLGFTRLNDTTGAFESFGPWRTQWPSQRTRGALTLLSEAFAAANTAGRRIAVMAGQSSGNATSPFGCNLSALGLPNPFTTPPDSVTSTSWTVANQGLILHDLQHRQARDTRYKICGWSSPGQPQHYDCRISNYITSGTGVWGGPVPALGENDTVNGGVWIDLPDKAGMLFYGHLVTTPEGYQAPGDPDGFVHMWYGDPEHASKSGSTSAGFANGKCCHGQDDAYWGATGPGAHYRVPMAWVYSPDDFVDTAKGTAELWSRTPRSTFQWRQAQLPARLPSGMFGGHVFDAQSRRLYVLVKKVDTVSGLYPRPALMVFDIA